MDETEVADALYEALELVGVEIMPWEDPLKDVKVTRDDTGLEITTPDGKKFRALIVEVPA